MPVMGESLDTPRLRIFMVRHGETRLNKEKRMRGWLDVPLTAQGLAEAAQAGHALASTPLDALIVSDLTRTQQTAEAISTAQAKAPKLILTQNLRTIDIGQWTGKPCAEFDPKLSELQKTWQTDPGKEPPGGESWTSFQHRMLAAAASVLAMRGNVCLVTHLRVCVWWDVFALLDQMPIHGVDMELLNRVTQAPARITVLTLDKEGLKIEAANTTDVEDHQATAS